MRTGITYRLNHVSQALDHKIPVIVSILFPGRFYFSGCELPHSYWIFRSAPPATPANTIGMRMGIATFEFFMKIVRETGSREASRIATTHRLRAFA